jgi:hypothetical protein
MKTQQPQKALTARQKEYEVLAAFIDFHEEDPEELARYLLHCGIDSEAIEAAGGDVETAILEHYRSHSGYDVNRVAYDLGRWPPIVAHIRELKSEQREKRAAEERERYRERKSAH